jgi:hypothetical protein
MPQTLSARVIRRLGLAFGLLALVQACDCEDTIYAIPPPEDQVDVYEQNAAAEVDILWIIDNSESMAAEQTKIADRFSQFFRQLITSQVDYHIGVATTDPSENGRLRVYDGAAVDGCDGCSYVTNSVGCADPDVNLTGLNPQEIDQALLSSCQAQAVFRNLVQAGIQGSAFEEGFTQAAAALGGAVIDPATGFPTGELPVENSGFIRDGAALYIIFVSDEDEGAKADGSPIRYYQRLFEGLKGAGNENLVSVSAITGWPIDDAVPGLEEVCVILQSTFDNNPATDDPEAALVKEVMTRSVAPGGCVDQNAQNDANAFAETGSRYIELACRTGGVVANMCEADYSVALDRLGANAAGLLRKFTLSLPDCLDAGEDGMAFTEDDPQGAILDCDDNGNFDDEIDGLLCVSARPIGSADGEDDLISQDPVNGWVWEDATNSVRFNGNFVPAPGSAVSIRYKKTATCREDTP